MARQSLLYMLLPRSGEHSDILLGNLTNYIQSLPPPATAVVKRNEETFEEIPIRRKHVLEPPDSVLISVGSFGIQRDQLFPFVLLAQFSPPSSLSAGEFKWSVLRFLVLSPSITHNYFDVTVPDIDVGL